MSVRVVRVGMAMSVLLLTAVVVHPGAAQAGTGRPSVLGTAWFWNEKSLSAQGQTLPTLPEPADAASGIPAGALGVGYLTDQLSAADKVAALTFDLGAIPAGSSVTRFQLTVPLAQGAPQVQSGTAAISACENIDVFTPGPAPQGLDKAPPVSDPSCVPGRFTSGTGYVFDLTAMANDWSLGAPSLGVSLRPTLLDVTSARPFSVALAGKGSISTAAAWDPPAAPAAVLPAEQPGPAAPAAPAVPEPAALPGTVPGALAPVAAPAPAPLLDQPSLAPTPQPVALTPVALPRSLRPGSRFWLGVLGVVTLLGLAFLVQSDPMAPPAVDARRRRFAQVVRSGTS